MGLFYVLVGVFAGCWMIRGHFARGAMIALFLWLAFLSGRMDWVALLIAFGWGALWPAYIRLTERKFQFALYAALIVISFGFKLHQFPGFTNLQISEKFWLGLEAPLVGLLPLAFCVPLARYKGDWGQVYKGWWLAIGGIALMTVLAVSGGTVHWQAKWPTYAGLRYFSNFFLTCIPEEAFYRGFVQAELKRFLQGSLSPRGAGGIALVVSAAIFTLAHIGWSPNFAIFAFVFLAGLLYGGVYWVSGRIESSIFCHFLLNFLHMTFFSYHAM